MTTSDSFEDGYAKGFEAGLAAKEAKPAPMTRFEAQELLDKCIAGVGGSKLESCSAIDAILEASRGIPLSVARDMALGCVPPEAPINNAGTHIIWNDCRKAMTAAITATFKAAEESGS